MVIWLQRAFSRIATSGKNPQQLCNKLNAINRNAPYLYVTKVSFLNNSECWFLTFAVLNNLLKFKLFSKIL